MRIEYTKDGFYINGKPGFVVGGEIAHFRVSDKDLKNRMQLFKEAGGNMALTSIPWNIHEMEEGKILFDDCDYRNLKFYLETAKELDLGVYLRLGPLVYTELKNGGIPTWVFEKYPETKCMTIDGSTIEQLSYLNPTSLKLTKRFYKELIKEIKPYLVENGGPIQVLQLDNELAGVHTWSGTLDYNPDAMGYFKEDGLYVRFMKGRYQSIDNLNEAYGTAFKEFVDIDPRKLKLEGVSLAKSKKDYHDFYCQSLSEYFKILLSYVREEGVSTLVTANAANAYLLNYMKEISNDMKDEKFYIGFDNYYVLDCNWQNVSPTPKWYMKNIFAADALNEMGYPFITTEMQLGSYTDTPPVLKENIYAWNMLNLALGQRGVSSYIFAGGKDVLDTGCVTDIYDYQAPISYTGEIRESYYTYKEFNTFMHNNDWLLNAKRFSSVQVGYEWQSMRGNDYAAYANVNNTLQTEDRLIKGISYSLLSSCFSYRFKELTNEIDPGKPLILMSPDTMSEKAQENVVEFIRNGGKLYLLGTIPTLNESFDECTILKDYLGDIEFSMLHSTNPVSLMNGRRVYGINPSTFISKKPENYNVFALKDDMPIGIEFKKDKGHVYFLNGFWFTQNFIQVELLEEVLDKLGAKKCVKSSNRNVYTILNKDDRGNVAVFAINLYGGKMKTNLTVYFDNEEIELNDICLDALEARYIKVR